MGKIQIMRNKSFIIGITTISLALFALSSPAGIYKWVDENGQIHYGEQPGNTGAEKITIRQNETTKPRHIKKDDKKNTGKQAKEPAKPEPPQVSKKEKHKLCNEAKNDLAAIATLGRLREINEKGEYTYLTDQQKQQRIAAAKKKQREFCR